MSNPSDSSEDIGKGVKRGLAWVGLASLMLLGEFALRALRWKVLMCRLAPEAKVSAAMADLMNLLKE